MTDSTSPSPDAAAGTDDPFLWLEEVGGERALAWVRERNAETRQALESRPDYLPTRDALRRVLDSKERIAHVVRRGALLYNFWRDDVHPRGLWRRTTLREYRKPQPDWETVLDLDALALAENANWVWAGAGSLGPLHERCIVLLSRGGADAHVAREFDTVAKRFVEGGFELPEAKSSVEWIDADSLYVATDFGAGSLTDSGYPRVVKRWARGTPLAAAPTVFEGEAEDVSVAVSVDRTPGFERTVFRRATDFFHATHELLEAGVRRPFDIPTDATHHFWNHAGDPHDTLLLQLRSDLQAADRIHPAGSLLAIDAPAYLAGKRHFAVLFEPGATLSLAGFATTRHAVIVSVLDNVAGRLEEWQRTAAGFAQRHVAAPHPGTLGVAALADPLLPDDPLGDHYLLSYADFLTPDTLWLARTGSDSRDTLHAVPAMFDARGMEVEQAVAVSADGTRVPYFVVWPAGVDASSRQSGDNPTLLYGYGGFEISLEPWYSPIFGTAWLARGAVLVVANIRGGGEFGPAWHRAAMTVHKQRSHDDFIAVAQALIARRITSPRHLGIEGGSNGGLLVGAAFTQRPDLFGAVVCQVPLLDMRRYHLLLAGASWVAEYGDPDSVDGWEAISKYSPYHNLREGLTYPSVLFTTSTRDDRVHPGHARKMAAKMAAMGLDVRYHENIEGGHGGGADNAQAAHVKALEFCHLWQQLGR